MWVSSLFYLKMVIFWGQGEDIGKSRVENAVCVREKDRMDKGEGDERERGRRRR